MRRINKYMSVLAFAGVMAMLTAGNVYAQRGDHGGGGHGGSGGGSHGGGGGSHAGGGSPHAGGGGPHSGGGGSPHGGGGGLHGGGSGGFHVNNGGFHGVTANRGAVGIRGAGPRSPMAYHDGGSRGNIGHMGHSYPGSTGVRGYRSGSVAHGYAYRGGRYYYNGHAYYRGSNYHGGYYHSYWPGFRFGIGWGYPHFGVYYGYLPNGYYPFYWNSLPYYYYGGVFYQPYNDGYQVAAPPLGAAVPSLPSNAQSIVIDDMQYYESNGVYYQPDVNENGQTIYIVVGRDGVLNTENGGGTGSDMPMRDYEDPTMDNAPANGSDQLQNTTPAKVAVTIKVGEIVNQLPSDCHQVTLNNKEYFVSSDNVFYEKNKDATGSGYRVASVPPKDEAGQSQN